MKQDQETLGRYLRREREKRHVTVEELALFVGVPRSLVDALDADDLDCFSGRADCLRLVKQYSGYLNLDRTEVVRRFDGQWKTSAGQQRFPKLTHYGDDASRRVFGGKRLFNRVSGRKMAVISLLGALLLAVPFLGYYLPDLRTRFAPREATPPEVRQPVSVPPEPTPPGPSPQSGVVKKAIPPPGERAAPAASVAVKAAVPKHAPAIDPLYTPPGRAERRPVPPPKGSARVVGNRDTKRYHLPGMKYYDKVKEHHRVVFPSEREAVRAGYVKAPQ